MPGASNFIFEIYNFWNIGVIYVTGTAHRVKKGQMYLPVWVYKFTVYKNQKMSNIFTS